MVLTWAIQSKLNKGQSYQQKLFAQQPKKKLRCTNTVFECTESFFHNVQSRKQKLARIIRRHIHCSAARPVIS